MISLEDIPVTQSALGQQVVILLPEALQISAESAKECLSKHLSVSALQALQVSLCSWQSLYGTDATQVLSATGSLVQL